MTVKEIVAATGGRLLCGPSDLEIKNISIDSRVMAGSDLFVPLAGEHVDAHRFIEQAFGAGAAAALTSEHDNMEDGRPWIYVEDTLKALQALGRYCRDRLAIPLVGITGSVGKTTAREMTAAALSARYKVFETPGNHNGQIGVPLTLSEIGAGDEIGVLELGMSLPGEMTVIAQIARVDMAVITNVGVTHIEQLGSQENILREKLAIQDGWENGGILFLNGDDPRLRQVRAKDGCFTVYFGTGENCGYRAEEIRTENGCAVFTADCRGEKVPVRLGLMGRHHVVNAMAAMAVAHANGVNLEEAARKLGEFHGYQGRQQVYEKDGIYVIDDTYNACPASMAAGLEVLGSVQRARRRIAVLADMKELGAWARRFHREIGEHLAQNPVDVLVTFGSLALEIEAGARNVSGAGEYFHFEEDDHEGLCRFLADILKPGDCVLLKGSNSMRLGLAVPRILGRSDTPPQAPGHIRSMPGGKF